MTIEATTPGEAAEVETPDVDIETHEAELDADGNPVEQPEPVEETEEVEHEGKKYKLPKPLKPALLMQADYTRKTQELAEQRRQHEETQRQFADRQKTESEFVGDIGRLAAYDDALKEFDKVDWQTLFTQNKAAYDQLQFQRQQTLDARNKHFTALQGKVAERQSKAQQESATRLEQARTAIARDIKDWSPELAGKLNQFASERFGFTPQELGQVTDPRIVKLLHAAYAGSQVQTKQAAVKKAEAVEAAKPLPTVGGASPTKAKATESGSDKLSTDEWLRRRNTELKHKRGR